MVRGRHPAIVGERLSDSAKRLLPLLQAAGWVRKPADLLRGEGHLMPSGPHVCFNDGSFLAEHSIDACCRTLHGSAPLFVSTLSSSRHLALGIGVLSSMQGHAAGWAGVVGGWVFALGSAGPDVFLLVLLPVVLWLLHPSASAQCQTSWWAGDRRF
jgi:hypothetical protein